MQVEELQKCLEENSESYLTIVLPSGGQVPDHFHVTEVGRIDKTFIDCGGTQRQLTSCLLQVWTANDLLHRLTCGKLAKILHLAEPVLRSVELPVEVEYGVEVAAQYVVANVEVSPDTVQLHLKGKQTECLAQDRCGVNECSDPGCCC